MNPKYESIINEFRRQEDDFAKLGEIVRDVQERLTRRGISASLQDNTDEG